MGPFFLIFQRFERNQFHRPMCVANGLALNCFFPPILLGDNYLIKFRGFVQIWILGFAEHYPWFLTSFANFYWKVKALNKRTVLFIYKLTLKRLSWLSHTKITEFLFMILSGCYHFEQNINQKAGLSPLNTLKYSLFCIITIGFT